MLACAQAPLLRRRLTLHEKQACFRLHMQQLSATMSSSEGMRPQRRVDVGAHNKYCLPVFEEGDS